MRGSALHQPDVTHRSGVAPRGRPRQVVLKGCRPSAALQSADGLDLGLGRPGRVIHGSRPSTTLECISLAAASGTASQSRSIGRQSCIGLVIPVDSIPPLRLGEVVPRAVAKRDPDVPTSEPSDAVAVGIPARSPVERSTSAERQPKLVFAERHLTLPTHAPPDYPGLSSGVAAGA